MSYGRATIRGGAMVAAIGLLLTACGGSSNLTVGATPTQTATFTLTPTALPTTTPTVQTASAVTGLVVLRRDFASAARDGVGTPPSEWMQGTDNVSFGRALAHADWSVQGMAGNEGVTAADGTFAINGLPPGRYILAVTKTLDGNLVPLTIPFTVGDDGTAELVIEVGLGLVRTTLTYTQGGVQVREIRGPYGNWLITRAGRISELGDPSRVLTDSDGDGHFDGAECVEQVWSCGSDGACGDQRFCQCLAACPFCENCSVPGVCAPKGTPPLYTCGAGGTCARPGDRCVCASSCPQCDDCVQQVCVPSCAPLDITAITIIGSTQLVVGRQTQLSATAQLSDGSAIDVTYLATWQSSDDAIASVDSWGGVAALTVGNAAITASLGAISSTPWPLQVVERPTLQRIFVQNQSCLCPPGILGAPQPVAALRPCMLTPISRTDILPIPSCGQVVVIGGSLQFIAIGEFADGSSEDISDAVEWQVLPVEVGDVVQGLFTGRQAGTANLTASLSGVTSDATEIRVVTEPTADSLSIYPSNWTYIAIDGGPVRPGIAQPCFDCGTAVTVLRGDTLQFQATAHYDTGEWRDVTAQVTWRSSDAMVAPIDTAGTMTAAQGGDTAIDAVLGTLTSNPVNVQVVNQATLQSLSIYQEGGDRAVSKGDQRFFHAIGYYDIGISRDVTAEATWRTSDDSIGGFDTPGVFTGRAAGTVDVWAELAGQQSPSLTLEVFELSELSYCDPDHINRAVWSDDFNRVTLESDCAEYTEPGVATLRYTVTETQPHGGVFDPCLDLYVYQDQTRIRTIREEGCGDPFVAAAAPGRDDVAVKYQLRAFWDLKDDDGNPVPAGTYTIYGRFYLYFDPVVSLDVTVLSSSGPPVTPLPTRTPTPAPNSAVVIRLGNSGGAPGEQVAVDVSMQAGMATVAGTQNDLLLGTSLRIDQGPDGGPYCKVNPMINKPGTRFGYLPPGCHPGVDCDGVRAIVLSLNNVTAIPDGALLYTCVVTIPPAAPPGVYPLRCSGAIAAGPTGESLPTRCLDGSVAVNAPTPSVVCTPPLCRPGEVFSCPDKCPGGCGTICTMPTPVAPPPTPSEPLGVCCQRFDGDVPHCSGPDPGTNFGEEYVTCMEGGGRPAPFPPYVCNGQTGKCEAISMMPTPPMPTPAPPPPVEGACFIGSSNCTGSYVPSTQARCCDLFRFGALPEAISWCPTDRLDPMTGKCTMCPADPCEGVPTFTPTPAMALTATPVP